MSKELAEQVIVDSSTGEEFIRNSQKYDLYPLPLSIDRIDRHFIQQNIEQNNELCFVTLKALCEAYFPSPNLMYLADLTYGKEDDTIISNSSFFVCIGTKKAYNKNLKTPYNQRSKAKNSLFLQGKPDYASLFTDFLKQFFSSEDVEAIKSTYVRTDIITISIFYREEIIGSKKDAERPFMSDHLVACASIVSDDFSSVMLSWLGVINKLSCAPPKDNKKKDIFKDMQGKLKFGSFLVTTCQLLGSLKKQRWIPILCQVYNVASEGPLNFYRKMFFVELMKNHQLIHDQYLQRRDHVITNDAALIWMVLFQPLQYLLMFHIENKIDNESVKQIIEAADFFFLEQLDCSPYDQSTIQRNIERSLRITNIGESRLISLKRLVTDPDSGFDDEEAMWIHDYDHETAPANVLATPTLFRSLFSVDNTTMLKTLNYVELDPQRTRQSNVLFMVASKLFFGKPAYHYIIRQCLYFIFRNLSRLGATHPFFTIAAPSLIQKIIARTYNAPSGHKYGAKELIKINGLYSKVSEITDSKGKVLKMFYTKVLRMFSESYLKSKFLGEEGDIFFLAGIMNCNLRLVNLSTDDNHTIEANYQRGWDIDVRNELANLSKSIEAFEETLQYIRSVSSVETQHVQREQWLARFDENKILVISEATTDELEPESLRLPMVIGGQIFKQIIHEKPPENVTDPPPLQIPDVFNDLMERIEMESNSKSIQEMYENHLIERDWRNKKYTKYFKSTGLMELENKNKDETERIGPVFDLQEFVDACIDPVMIMPVMRIIDPWKQVVDLQFFPIKAYAAFKDLISFRKETWLTDSAMAAFIDWLNKSSNQFDNSIHIIDPYHAQLIISRRVDIEEYVHRNCSMCSMLIICAATGSHFFLVEVPRPSTVPDSKVTVTLADSEMATLEDIVEDVRACNIDLIIDAFAPNHPIEFELATDVVKQENSYDCGVHCLQRLYFWRRFNRPSLTASNATYYLNNTVLFRIFALVNMLTTHIDELGPLLYFPNQSISESEDPWRLPSYSEQYTQIVFEDEPLESELTAGDFDAASGLMNLNNNQQENTTQSNEEAAKLPLAKTHKASRKSATSGSEADEDDDDDKTPQIDNLKKHKSTSAKAVIVPEYASDDPQTESEDDDNATIQGQEEEEEIQPNQRESDKGKYKINMTFQAGSWRSSRSKQASIESNTPTTTEDTSNEPEVIATTIEIIDPEKRKRREARRKRIRDGKHFGFDPRIYEVKGIGGRSAKFIIGKRKINPDVESSSDDYDEDSVALPVAQPITQQKKKSKYNPPPKKPKTREKPLRKRIVRSRTKRLNSTKNQQQQERLQKQQEKLERLQAQREAANTAALNVIERRMERWNSYLNPPDHCTEADIFQDDPLYFVNKKLPNAPQELLNDLQRVNQRLYEPLQYDVARAKQAVEAVTNQHYRRAQADYQRARTAFENIETDEADLISHTSKYWRLKNKCEELKQKTQMMQEDITWQYTLLPYDSVYALRSSFNKTDNRIDYFAVCRNPDGSMKEKIVTREWLRDNVEPEFLNRFFKSEKEKGWVFFSPAEADLKIIRDDEDVRAMLDNSNIRPIYVYQPRENDDKIHCIRVGVDFEYPHAKCIPASYQWAIMTEKQSLTGRRVDNVDPWTIRDKDNKLVHTYHECNETLLITALGEDFHGLIMNAIQRTFLAEFENPGKPYLKPNFIFDGVPYVTFIPQTVRDIDLFDYVKTATSKKKMTHFHPNFCGIFSNRQYYYFDLRSLTTTYYVNITTRQISGLMYDSEDRTFIGLEKYGDKGKYRNVRLESDWVTLNFEQPFIDMVMEKNAKEKNRFVKLPVGKGRPQQKRKDLIKKTPRIAYPQYGADTCVFSSISSALYYLEFEDVALQIDDYKNKLIAEGKIMINENLMATVVRFINSQTTEKFRKRTDIMKIEYPHNFDVLDHCRRKPNILYHVVIRCDDGAENHAICIVHNLIFDGNHSNALPLSMENLNACCDSVFKGISIGYKYFLPNS
jgi:hypothetical protein